jgi:4-hydroxybenzoate polyprenyltransferase
MMSLRWMGAWLNERFPLRNGVFFVLLYATTLLVARAAVAPAGFEASLADLPGLLALWSFFLLLRVFDEHKDFAADAVAHPERVLQRGLVTLRQLRVVGAGAVVVQVAASVWLDRGVGTVTAWWLASLAWSLLMAREFFVPNWLRRHLMVYAVSHMAVMLLLVGWVAAMGHPSAPRAPTTWALGGVVFVAGMVMEVARKLRAPEDERPMADSYTRALGTGRASVLLAVLVVVTCVAAIALAHFVNAPTSLLGPVTVTGLSLLTVLAALGFGRRPTRRRARLTEAAAALAIMSAHVLLVAAVIGGRIVTWR